MVPGRQVCFCCACNRASANRRSNARFSAGLQTGKVVLAGVDQRLLDAFEHVFLVRLDRQDAVAALVDDLLGDGLRILREFAQLPRTASHLSQQFGDRAGALLA